MYRRIALILAGVLAAVTMLASPAQAAPVDCPTAHVCFWADANYPGMPQIWYAPSQTPGCVNVPAYMNDRISSWVSKTGVYNVALLYNSNCGGRPVVDSGGPWASHSVDIWWWCNDCTSSILFTHI